MSLALQHVQVFISGFGISMVYLPAILAVGFYFENHRALANGITMSGSGIGTFIYSPLCNYLQSEYSWKGAVLILSGITLHCIALGALFRPLRKSKRQRAHSQSATSSSGSSHSSKYVDVLESISKDEHNLLLNKSVKTPVLNVEGALKSQSYSNLNANTRFDRDSKPATKLSPNNNTAIKKLPHIAICDSISASTGYLPDKSVTISSPPHHVLHKSGDLHGEKPRMHKNTPWMTTLYRKDLFYSGSFSRLPEYRESSPGASLYSLTAIKNAAESTSSEEEGCRSRLISILTALSPKSICT